MLISLRRKWVYNYFALTNLKIVPMPKKNNLKFNRHGERLGSAKPNLH